MEGLNINNNLIQDIKIIPHNVMHWTKERSIKLSNYYRPENPDIILLNSTSIVNEDKIKTYNHNVIQKNMLNERSAGIAVAIRKNIKYRIIDDFIDDVLGTELRTSTGPIIILTNYSPPRRNYVPIGELENVLQKNMPVYFVGDINNNIPALGYATYNSNGRAVKRLIEQDKIKLMGPDFRMLIHRNGRPNIVFSNIFFLNYAIVKGKLTSSDHLPVILNISTKPIVKPGQEKYKFSEANWELFKEKVESKIAVENNTSDLLNRNNIDAQEIENNILKWLSIITETRDEVIPKVKLCCYIHATDSDYLRLLEITHRNILNKPYWTREDLDIIKEVQRRLLEENLRLYKKAWGTKIESLNELYKDSAKFRSKTKQCIGNPKEKVDYQIDSNKNNNKVYKDNEKEVLYRNIWERIFKIPPEENKNLDIENENLVREFLTQNQGTIEPYQYANLTRLEENSILLKPVRANDIVSIIKGFKNKSPDLSGINKLILSQLPANAREKLDSNKSNSLDEILPHSL